MKVGQNMARLLKIMAQHSRPPREPALLMNE
jgi:hypothetical protein